MPLTRKRFLDLAGRGALGTAAYSTFGFLDRATRGADLNGKPCPAGTDTPDARFLFRGSAVGLGGRITDPPLGDIPAQAATTLPPDGGHADARVDGYGFHGIVYVNEAYSLVRGNPDIKRCRPVFRTVTTATVNGLDVDGVVRADTVVASLESDQPEKGEELDMLPVGYFSNLRIKGFPIDPRPHADLLVRGRKSEIDRCLPHLFDPYDPGNVSGKPTALGAGRSRYTCSIFDDESIEEGVKRIPPSAGVEALRGGHLRIADFGDVYLGELIVDADFRRLTMLRLVLASPPTGWVTLAAVEGDGRPF